MSKVSECLIKKHCVANKAKALNGLDPDSEEYKQRERELYLENDEYRSQC